MNAITQYLELYRQNRAIIERNSPAALSAWRDEALRRLGASALPRRGDEDYEATDLNAIFAPDYGVNINRVKFTVDNRFAGFNCALPSLSASPYFVVNDSFQNAVSANLPQGVVVGAFSEVERVNPALLERYYNSVAARRADVATSLNTLLAQDGTVVFVPKGVTVEKPIQIINVMNASARMMSLRRLLIVLEAGAKATVLACDHSLAAGSQDYLVSQVVEISLGEGASLEYYDMEETGKGNHRVSALYSCQAGGSNLLIDNITLNNDFTRNDFYLDIDGEHCDTSLLGMTIASQDQHVDNHTFIAHNSPRCKSNEMFKYTLDDNAVGAFAGKILVRPDCPGVDAYQGNRNLCSSSTAKIYTKPQLEIYTDDVKCAHGSTIGQLDAEALFYMRQRGISLEAARTLLKQAFMADVIDAVRLPALRERLRHLVEQRFAGLRAMCNNCALR